MRRASSRSSIAVSPGVATTARSHSSAFWVDDDVAARLRALARGRHPGLVLQPQVDDLALDGAHRLELDPLARAGTVGGAPRHRLARRGAAGPVGGGAQARGLPP